MTTSTADEELLKMLEDLTKGAARHQTETLQSILHHQRGVYYLRRYLSGYSAPVDADTYRRAVPLSCYDNFAVYINQLADGADCDPQPLLSFDPLVCFFYSSGTSSMKPKLIPYFDSELSKAASYLSHQGSSAILRRYQNGDENYAQYIDCCIEKESSYKGDRKQEFPLQGSEKEPVFQMPLVICQHSLHEVSVVLLHMLFAVQPLPGVMPSWRLWNKIKPNEKNDTRNDPCKNITVKPLDTLESLEPFKLPGVL